MLQIRSKLPQLNSVIRSQFIIRQFSNSSLNLEEKKSEPKRFWKNVSVSEDADGFGVKLDGRSVKTPIGTKLVIPSDKPLLANLIAGEWESQQKIIKPHSLPLTSLVARSIDDLSLEAQRIIVYGQLERYLHTDTLCYRQGYPEKLNELQDIHWTPVHNWVNEKFGVKLKTTESIIGSKQSKEVAEPLLKVMMGFDPLTLAGFERAVIASKSFILGLQVILGDQKLEEICQASQVELKYQQDFWGEVEDAHDVAEQDLLRQIGAAKMVVIE